MLLFIYRVACPLSNGTHTSFVLSIINLISPTLLIKGSNGVVLNQAWTSLNIGSLYITFTVLVQYRFIYWIIYLLPTDKYNYCYSIVDILYFYSMTLVEDKYSFRLFPDYFLAITNRSNSKKTWLAEF